MQRNFRFFHTTDVEICENLPNLEEFHISPHDRYLIYPVFLLQNLFYGNLRVIYEIRFGAIYALLRGDKQRWRKNDKYQVCTKPLGSISQIDLRNHLGCIPIIIGCTWNGKECYGFYNVCSFASLKSHFSQQDDKTVLIR